MKIIDIDDYIEVQMNRNNFSLFNVENLCKYSLLLFFVLYHIYVVIFIISQTPDVMNCVDLF